VGPGGRRVVVTWSSRRRKTYPYVSAQKSSWPQTIPEAVEQLLGELSAETAGDIAHLPEDALISLHFGLGQYIRNRYGLWQGNEALLADCAAVSGRSGDVSWLWIDPDDASSVILTALWRRLQD
jgi:hypothetical protein